MISTAVSTCQLHGSSTGQGRWGSSSLLWQMAGLGGWKGSTSKSSPPTSLSTSRFMSFHFSSLRACPASIERPREAKQHSCLLPCSWVLWRRWFCRGCRGKKPWGGWDGGGRPWVVCVTASLNQQRVLKGLHCIRSQGLDGGQWFWRGSEPRASKQLTTQSPWLPEMYIVAPMCS